MSLTIDTAAVEATRSEILEWIRICPDVGFPPTRFIISVLLKHSVDVAPVHLATPDREDPAKLATHYSKDTIIS